MAGFRGVMPSQETVRQILDNLERGQRAMSERVATGTDPFHVGPDDHSRLIDSLHLNTALIEVFTGLLD